MHRMDRSRARCGRCQTGNRTCCAGDVLAHVLAVLVVAMGVANILSAWSPVPPERMALLRQMLPLAVRSGSRTLTVFTGLSLILLGRGLFRRKKQAWALTMILLSVSVVTHLLKGLNVGEALSALVLAGLLWNARRHYVVLQEPTSLRQTVAAVLRMTGVMLGYGLVGLWVLRHQFRPAAAPTQMVWELISVWFTMGSGPLMPATHRAAWFVGSLDGLAALTALYAVGILLRPVLFSSHRDEEGRQRAAQLLAEYGGEPLSHFALARDKLYYFGPGGRSFVAFRGISNVALALGDPVGDPGQIPDAVASFQAWCQERDWIPAFYQVGGRYLAEYRKLGFRLFKVGEEPILDLPAFSLQGKAIAEIRHATSHALREGIRAEFYDFFADPLGIRGQIAEISADWLAQHRGGEMGFAMGKFEAETLEQERLMVALDRENRVLAFVTFAPVYPQRGYVLDLMRRRTRIPNGTMEFLIGQAALRFREEGAAILSLGLAPLAESGKTEAGTGAGTGEDPLLARARGFLFDHLNAFYNFQTLYRFKRDFNPRWESRYLVYPNNAALPKVLYAIVRAQSPGGLWDYLGLGRRTPVANKGTARAGRSPGRSS